MKVAVASTDGVSISRHFGRSACFLIFETADGKIVGQDVRSNSCTPHARGECREGEHHHDQPHSHADIVAALGDCQVVLCAGMGARAAEELRANGIRPVIVDATAGPQQAVRDLLDGTLRQGEGFCRCHD